MRKYLPYFLISAFIFFFISHSKADTLTINFPCNADSLIPIKENSHNYIVISADSVIPEKKRVHENKKLISAILAFPFPFGILGLHRIYLGTKPYMPFVYVGTIGGCFGILPLIDFITILIADDETLKSFENNPKVFMWSH